MDSPRARLRVAEQEASVAWTLIRQIVDDELRSEEPDEDTILFLLDEAQSKIAKVRWHVRFVFSGAGEDKT